MLDYIKIMLAEVFEKDLEFISIAFTKSRRKYSIQFEFGQFASRVQTLNQEEYQ